MLSPCCEKDLFVSAALHKKVPESDWRSDIVRFWTPDMCHYSNTGIKNGHCSSIFLMFLGMFVCSTYTTRQVSKSWHTLDGVLHTNKGRTKSNFSCNIQGVPVTNQLYEIINSGWQSQHNTSVLIIITTEFEIVLDLWTKIT